MLKGIYKSEEFDTVTILIPTQEIVEKFDSEYEGVFAICEKDVPENVPFWIVDITKEMEDTTFRDAWEIDYDKAGEPDGYGNSKNTF